MLTFLRRPLLHFEFPGDGGGAPGVGEPIGEPAGEPSPWGGPSQDEWGSVMGYIQQQQAEREAYDAWQAEQQAAMAAQQQGQQFALDPFAENFGEQFQGAVRQAIQEALQPINGYIQQAQQGEGEERALDILEDVVSREGDFRDNQRAFAQARALSNVYFAEEVARYGYGPEAAEAALLRAAADVRAYENAIAEGAVGQHMNQLKTLSTVAPEPGSTYAQGFQERTIPNYREGGSVSDRIFGSGAAG